MWDMEKVKRILDSTDQIDKCSDAGLLTSTQVNKVKPKLKAELIEILKSELED